MRFRRQSSPREFRSVFVTRNTRIPRLNDSDEENNGSKVHAKYALFVE